MKLSKVYEPQQYEGDIYALWEAAGAFKPKNRGEKGNYSIVVPPPNANGNLHIGHGLTLAIEDILVRYNRMLGKASLLLPGADHAGFETWVVYEKKLAKEGKSRFDFSREELYKQVWDFVALNRSNFEKQMRSLGASVDWDRYTFTLDEPIVNQAYETFHKLWEQGLIYRGERLVNFCTFHGTSFADVEVTYKEVKGHLWHIRYPLTDGSGAIVVATTRPETMLGDVAVAVSPSDDRYKALIGKTVKLPLTHREIPIIADDFVEAEFGTGAVKITPAHDQTDYDAGQRHDLPLVTVIDHEGKMTHAVPESYRGLSVEVARKQIARDLEKEGFLVKTEDYTHSVGHCYKCGTVIQPLLREQWFVDMQPLAKEAVKVLKEDKITFYPAGKKDQLIHYLEGLRDWNISRQIAWGIPIPAFQSIENPEDWVFDIRVDQEVLEIDGKQYRRDPDVFDTWFSSSSWPYAALGYPDSKDFEQFYPLSVMETGGEILYPWVSRMLMLGLYVTGEIPFKDVYIHGYVMAEDGAKMSKSLGNVIDPMDVVNQYGSDALRMGIIAGRVPGVNRGYDSRKVQDARNFANKLWNTARYVEDKIGDNHTKRFDPKPVTAADHWMLNKLQQSTEKIADCLDRYDLAVAYETLYHLVWDEFADWYIEASKIQPNASVLAYTLETILKLAHPFAPFVTETIWQTMAWEENTLLITSHWPKNTKYDRKRATAFEEVKSIVTEVRIIVSALQAAKPTLYYTNAPFLTENAELIQRLARLEEVQEVSAGKGLHLTQTTHRCWLDIDQQTARAYLAKLEQQREERAASVKRLQERLENKAYISKAPKELVKQSKAQLAEEEALFEKITTELANFQVATRDLTEGLDKN